MWCLAFSNGLKWAPRISGNFLCILPSLLYAALRYAAASASPKSDCLLNSVGPPPSAWTPPLCTAMWKRPHSSHRTCCSSHRDHNLVLPVLQAEHSYLIHFSHFLVIYSGRTSLALVTLPWQKQAFPAYLFHLIPPHVELIPNYYFPTLH